MWSQLLGSSKTLGTESATTRRRMSCKLWEKPEIPDVYFLPNVKASNARKKELVLYGIAVEKWCYHEKRTNFIKNLFNTEGDRVDAGAAERYSNCGAGLFSMVANATRTEYLAFSHSSRSCSRVIISRGASLGGLWLSVTVNQDESSSSRVSKPDVVFFSKVWTLLYVALNFREPNKPLCQWWLSKGANWYEDRPWTLAASSTEKPVVSDRSLMVRLWRSCAEPTQEDEGKPIEKRHQETTFSP